MSNNAVLLWVALNSSSCAVLLRRKVMLQSRKHLYFLQQHVLLISPSVIAANSHFDRFLIFNCFFCRDILNESIWTSSLERKTIHIPIFPIITFFIDFWVLHFTSRAQATILAQIWIKILLKCLRRTLGDIITTDTFIGAAQEIIGHTRNKFYVILVITFLLWIDGPLRLPKREPCFLL